MKLHTVLAGLLILMTVLFGSATAGSAPVDDAQQSEVKIESIYSILRRDPRKCPSPMCGGYWMKPLNSNEQELYVSNMELASPTELDDNDLHITIFKGHLSEPEPMFSTRVLIVEAMYRQQTAIQVDHESVFATVSLRVPPHACVTAPCSNLLAKILNHSETIAFDQFDFSLLPKPDLGESWTKLVLNPEAIVAGTFESGKIQYPGGFEQIFKLFAYYRSQNH